MECLLPKGCGKCPAPYHSFRKPPNLVEEEFKRYSGAKGKMTAQDLTKFMESQGDEDVEEKDVKTKMENFIRQLTESKSSRHLRILRSLSSVRGSRSLRLGSGSSRHSKHGHVAAEKNEPTFTLALFLKFLLSPAYNDYYARPSKKQITDDMTAPLSHYYIFSSHNTYLTGNQLTSPTSTVAIANALQSGCRVIELDCWDDPKGTIKVTHGKTLTSKVGLEDCITTLKEHAFSASEYPVIVTIENHLSTANQKETARLLKKILGEDMFIPSNKDQRPLVFLSPEALKRKIIISDKPPGDPVVTQVAEETKFAEEVVAKELQRIISSGSSAAKEEESGSRRAGRRSCRLQNQVVESNLSLISGEDSGSQDKTKDPDFKELLYIDCRKPSEMEERPEKRGPLKPGQFAVMANLSEAQLIGQIRDYPDNIIEFSKTNLVRMYPFGLRVFSSNPNPMHGWSRGVQVVAINMQGKDRAVWISKALFSKNGGCGFVKKPDILLPGSSLTHEDLGKLKPKLELKVRVLMGTDWDRHYDLLKKPDYFVKVAVHGMCGDDVKLKTKVERRSREPHWNEEFKFQIRVPELAILRLEVKEHDTCCRNDMVGQSCVPVTDLRQGIRVVNLKSTKGELLKSKILCHFSMCSLAAETSNLLKNE